MKVNFITRVFESKPVQGFYKKICDPKHATFFNNTLPTLETLVATGLYVWSTEQRKEIPREQRNVLQWQNILSGAAGMAVGSFLNRRVSKFAEKLEPLIDKKLFDVHKVVTGIKIGLPLLATALTMRLGMSVLTAQASTMIEDRRREKKKQLDTKA